MHCHISVRAHHQTGTTMQHKCVIWLARRCLGFGGCSAANHHPNLARGFRWESWKPQALPHSRKPRLNSLGRPRRADVVANFHPCAAWHCVAFPGIIVMFGLTRHLNEQLLDSWIVQFPARIAAQHMYASTPQIMFGGGQNPQKRPFPMHLPFVSAREHVWLSMLTNPWQVHPGYAQHHWLLVLILGSILAQSGVLLEHSE